MTHTGLHQGKLFATNICIDTNNHERDQNDLKMRQLEIEVEVYISSFFTHFSAGPGLISEPFLKNGHRIMAVTGPSVVLAF